MRRHQRPDPQHPVADADSENSAQTPEIPQDCSSSPLGCAVNGGPDSPVTRGFGPLLRVEGAYGVMYPLRPPVRRGTAALPFGGAVRTVDPVDPPFELFTGPVQPGAQVEPVPILAGFGR